MSHPLKKRFALDPSSFKPLAEGRGSCQATDRITVDGKPVGFMYRELPDNDIDSGWRFFSDGDTQEYADDPANCAIYDITPLPTAIRASSGTWTLPPSRHSSEIPTR
jgi:hypothetical protein